MMAIMTEEQNCSGERAGPSVTAIKHFVVCYNALTRSLDFFRLTTCTQGGLITAILGAKEFPKIYD